MGRRGISVCRKPYNSGLRLLEPKLGGRGGCCLLGEGGRAVVGGLVPNIKEFTLDLWVSILNLV